MIVIKVAATKIVELLLLQSRPKVFVP